MNIVYVVGDGFRNFLNNQNVISISEFEKRIQLPRIPNSIGEFYIIGQGVSEVQINRINQFVDKYKIKNIYIKGSNIVREQDCYVHKTRPENVMIAMPVKVSADFYVSRLMVDDDCAEMSDHVTGQHVQGMVIIESARQMMLSVSERYLLSEQARFNSYFVLQNMDIQFKQFVFPIDAEIHCQLIEHKKMAENKFHAKMRIDFLQNNSLCSHVYFEFLADEKNKLQKKEAKLASLNLQLAHAKEIREMEHFPEAQMVMC